MRAEQTIVTTQDTKLSARTPQSSPVTVAERSETTPQLETKQLTRDGETRTPHKKKNPTEIQQVISKQKHYMFGAFQ